MRKKKGGDEEVMWQWFEQATPDERYRRVVAFRSLVSSSVNLKKRKSVFNSREWLPLFSKGSRLGRSTPIFG
jgi:hypothetical protein